MNSLIGAKVRTRTAIPHPVNKTVYAYGAILEVDGNMIGVLFTNEEVEWVPIVDVEYLDKHGKWISLVA